MPHSLINPTDTLERQNAKLLEITSALMRRVENQTERDGAAYAQFERAVVLEDQVRRRTDELEAALGLLNESNAKLSAANRQIEEARRDLASAIEAVQEGFALFGADDVLLLYNRRFCWQMPDVRGALTPGMTFRDYIGQVSRSRAMSLPDDMTAETWGAARLRRHREPHVIFNLALTGDRWLQISEHRTENAGTAIVQTDVTDIIRSEREARNRILDSQSRMIRATLDHLEQGVAIFDARSRLVGWNTRLQDLTELPTTAYRHGTGFSRIAEHLSHNFHMATRAEEVRLAQWVSGQVRQEPMSFEISQGGARVLRVFAQRLPDDGFVVSFTDVTLERESARSLARANETLERAVAERTVELRDALLAAQRSAASKSRFVAAASHDLLQPLSAAKLYLASAGDGPDPANAISKAEAALSNVEEILSALLDISRLETDESTFEQSDIPLSAILTPIEHGFAPMAAAKGLDLRVMPSTAVVRSNAAYLQRIVQNLVSNAVRYTAKGRVLLGARHLPDGKLRIEVWDTGPGIPEEARGVIFEEFRRLDRRASASEGMGLGLAIVDRACARLGHPLELRSTPGSGSGFLVTLDRAKPVPILRARDGKVTDQPSNKAVPVPGLLVLLVDNDDQLRRALVTLLENWGISVLEADSAEAALNLLEEVQIAPDAMLFDYQLGDGMSGTDLAAVLRSRYGIRPTMVISANHSVELRRTCAEMGLDLLNKPINTTKLHAFLASVEPVGT